MPLLLLLVLLGLTACSSPAPATAGAQDASSESADSSGSAATAPRADIVVPAAARVRKQALSPLADSLSHMLVFIPRGRSWLTAAARGKRMLVDVGRVDAEVRRDPASLAAYKEAVAALSPLQVGERLRLRGRWGVSDVAVVGFDVWNGRIVAVVKGEPILDSLARVVEPLPASAVRIAPADSAMVAPADCNRTLDTLLARRADFVRDSIHELLRGRVPPARVAEIVLASSRAPGCFGAWRAALAISIRTKSFDWSEQRIVMLDSAGAVVPVATSDLRFRTHELLMAFDADGDGVDDIAARGSRARAGGTSILRLDPGAKRLVRLTSGFAWEQ